MPMQAAGMGERGRQVTLAKTDVADKNNVAIFLQEVIIALLVLYSLDAERKRSGCTQVKVVIVQR